MKTRPTRPSAETVDTSRHRALASTTRVTILQLVRRSPDGLTAAQVAEATGRHQTTVRDHLDQLTDAGLLIRERRRGGAPGRPAWLYRPGQKPEVAVGPHRELAGALVEHLGRTDDPRAAGVAAGRDWGRKLAAGAKAGAAHAEQRLIAVFDQLGFTPTVTGRVDGAAVLHLRSCPFLDLVDSHPDVVCGLHLGVIRGALGAVGASGTAATLEPFGAAGACVVRLGPAVPGDPPEASR